MSTEDGPADPASVSAPSLPKGGGAIRGLGEQFTANHAAGTGAWSVPISTSSGRADFGPQLSLSYDSANGNGVFGFGWRLSSPAITVKTNRGVPLYDGTETYLLTGADELVAVLGDDGRPVDDGDAAPGFVIRRFRPRIEDRIIRIERWTRTADGDVHWKTFSVDNVRSIFGAEPTSRIVDPHEPANVFAWQLSQTADDRGNALVYDYLEDVPAVGRAVNRHIKQIRYGNVVPLLQADGTRHTVLSSAVIDSADWMFRVVFDYGDHPSAAGSLPTIVPTAPCAPRPDPFSSRRASFEVRTTRRCGRILVFHAIPHDPRGSGPVLVTSTDLAYHDELADGQRHPYSMLASVTHVGYRDSAGGPTSRTMPPLEFAYSTAASSGRLETVDVGRLASGSGSVLDRWVDLHGEGAAGLLVERSSEWYFGRNRSPVARVADFEPANVVRDRPNTSLAAGATFVDLSGGGDVDVVVVSGGLTGFAQNDGAGGWRPLRPFVGLPTVSAASQFVDLTGDGLADLLTETPGGLMWHRSLGEDGFGPAQPVVGGPDTIVPAPRRAVRFADMTGDGLADIVLVGNGDVTYYPNLGHGRFDRPVVMDGAPLLDVADGFNSHRVVFADVDGSGTADLLYAGTLGVSVHPNLSGDRWGEALPLPEVPPIDDTTEMSVVDLFGRGTACLVMTVRSAGGVTQQRYVDLMSEGKPYLLTSVVNNLGSETRITYAPSTKFAVADRIAGMPWLTRLPMPVHVVERFESIDHISGNCAVRTNAFHHGDYDAVEREFNGFGMVEQWDFVSNVADLRTDTDAITYTRSWFHTGGDDRVLLDHFERQADAPDAFFHEPGSAEAAARLSASVIVDDVSLIEEGEARRALRGALLRQEIWSGGGRADAAPYSVRTSNYAVHRVQRGVDDAHAVFRTAARESLTSVYERDPHDPRTEQTLVLEVDDYGNVLRDVVVACGRRAPGPLTDPEDVRRQTAPIVTYRHHRFTNAITPQISLDDHRTPQPAEQSTYELVGARPDTATGRLAWDDLAHDGFAALDAAPEIELDEPPAGGLCRRLLDRLRTQYRPDDLGVVAGDASALLEIGRLEPRAMAGQQHRLVVTQRMLDRYLVRDGQPLLLESSLLARRRDPDGPCGGGFVDLDGDGRWWAPTSRTFLSPGTDDSAADELDFSRRHFSLPQRRRDPFSSAAQTIESIVEYDPADLLVVGVTDAVGNRTTAEYDYRVLRPTAIVDANGNRAETRYDSLGMPVLFATIGRAGDLLGDNLVDVEVDLSPDRLQQLLDDPLAVASTVLGDATSRYVVDLFAYARTKGDARPAPVVTHAIVRDEHVVDARNTGADQLQHHVAYSDGFGRVVQARRLVEPGPLDATGPDVAARWAVTGWVEHDAQGNALREYEPFFSETHAYEPKAVAGVAAERFYDPLGRLVATVHPNHSFEKVVHTAWLEQHWDPNDTVLDDPRTDDDIGDVVRARAAHDPEVVPPTWRTWYMDRVDGGLGDDEGDAASKAAAHARTPISAHLDGVGRPFLTVVAETAGASNVTGSTTRIDHDVLGRVRFRRDAMTSSVDTRGRAIEALDYDMLGRVLRERTLDGGSRWSLSDASGHLLRAWSSRGHMIHNDVDALGRPIRSTLVEPGRPAPVVTERVVYGDGHPEAAARNLRGRVFLTADQAGLLTVTRYDARYNVVARERRMCADAASIRDWTALDAAAPSRAGEPYDEAVLAAASGPIVDADPYYSGGRFDASNRAVATTAPHRVGDPTTVTMTSYERGGRIRGVQANIRGEVDDAGRPRWTPIVEQVSYDAGGRRQMMRLGNGAVTTYTHEPSSARLASIVSTRPVASPAGEQRNGGGRSRSRVQDLRYTYDAAGNIVRVRDDAQQAVFFKNRRVEAGLTYTYDAFYRLVEATGREHLGQTGQAGPHSFDDAGRRGLMWSTNDGAAMGRYVERYAYDHAGNMISMAHRSASGPDPGWERTFEHSTPGNRLDGDGPAATGNRLTASTITGSGNVDRYVYDDHGNTTHMPHLGGAATDANLMWDHHDQLATVVPATGTSHHVYDATGQRRRRVWHKSDQLTEDQLSLDDFTVFRRTTGVDERVHELVDIRLEDRCVATIEVRTADTAGNDRGPGRLVRYRLADVAGSTSHELDDDAAIISYEEYSPFGSTTYQAVAAVTDAPNRSRFSGHQRDDETGFSHQGARDYAPWLAKWTSCDPVGTVDHLNPYVYCHNRPPNEVDPGGTYVWAVLGVVVVVAIIIVTIEHPANAPSTKDVQQNRVEPRPPLHEDLARATAVAASGGAGSAIGKTVAVKVGGGVIGRLAAAGANGAVAGGTNAVGQQAADDLHHGKVSSPSTYGKRAVKEAVIGAGVGVVLEGAGTLAKKEVQGLTGGGESVPADYDKAGWDKYMKDHPNYRRDGSAAANDEWKKPETKKEADTRARAAADEWSKTTGKSPQKLPETAELHHVATDKAVQSGWTAKFQDLFDKAMLSLQDDANLVSVPGHQGSHGANYHQAIYNRLTAAVAGKTAYTTEYQQALKDALLQAKRDILQEGTYLNQLVTGATR